MQFTQICRIIEFVIDSPIFINLQLIVLPYGVLLFMLHFCYFVVRVTKIINKPIIFRNTSCCLESYFNCR